MRIILTTLLLFLTHSISNASIEEPFPIQSDLFYEQIKATAMSVHQQLLSLNGQVLIDTKTTYNDKGFITQAITTIDNVVIKATYDAYKGPDRTIILSSTHVTNTLTTSWSSPTTSHSSDGDMSTDYKLNDEGSIIYQKHYFKNEPDLIEITHFYYLNNNEQKPQYLIDHLKTGEKLIFVTILETDEKGSWIKQQKEEYNGMIELEVRTIKYLEAPQK